MDGWILDVTLPYDWWFLYSAAIITSNVDGAKPVDGVGNVDDDDNDDSVIIFFIYEIHIFSLFVQ